MKKTIQDYKKEATLNKVFRYPEGIMSRRDWLKMMQVKGGEVREETKRNYAAEEKLQASIDSRKWSIPWGNECHPLTKQWNEDKATLKAGIYKTVYYLQIAGENCFQEITKTEYEHFKAMQLEEDINTQKAELSEKIEAGTATDEEIDEAMQKEFEFAAKYF